MRIVSPDGSICGDKGKVLHFGVQRFINDVVKGNCCFMCGRAESDTVPFNNEHVIPQWVLRKYGMYDQSIHLSNGTSTTYGSYTVPCCAECNSDLGKVVEEPIKAMFSGGFGVVAARAATDAGADLLYCWCALIFLKAHLKDLSLRWELDRRKGDLKIGQAYDWNAMHHVQAIARCPLVGAELGRGALGTLVARQVWEGASRRFDYGDFSFAHTLMIQLDDVAVFAVLNDAMMCERVVREDLNRIGRLAPIQLREIMTQIAYINMRVDARPTFRTAVDAAGKLTVEADLPQKFSVTDFVEENYGKMLNFATQDIPVSSDVREAVKQGKYTFVFDNNRQFIDYSAIEAPSDPVIQAPGRNI